MATVLAPNFFATTDGGPILVAFSPSMARASSSGLVIDSRIVLGGRNPLQTSYLMTIVFDADSQGLLITEYVRSTAKAGNGVIGTARIPFAELGEPAFEYGKSRGISIRISLPLRQATDFHINHYSYKTLGKWKDATKGMLHLRQFKDMTSKIRRVEIDISNVQRTPSLARKQILTLLNLSTLPKPLQTRPSPNASPFIPKSAAPTEVDTEITLQMTRKQENAEKQMKRNREEDARLAHETQEFVETKLASTIQIDERRTICVTAIESELTVRGFWHGAYDADILEFHHVKDSIGENYFLFDFSSGAVARNALKGAISWIKALHWGRPEPIITLIDEQEKNLVVISAAEEIRAVIGEETQEMRSGKSGKDQYFRSDVSILRDELKDLDAKYQLCQEQLQIVLTAVGSLRQQEPSEDLLDQVLDDHAHLTSSSATRGRALFIATTESEEDVLDIMDCTDRAWIMDIVRMVSEDGQTGFKIAFVSHGTASEALRNTRHLILDNCDEWEKRPMIEFFPGEPTAQGRTLSTQVGRAKTLAPPITQILDTQMRRLREENRNLHFQMQDLKENNLERSEQVDTLQAEVARLTQQLSDATVRSQPSTRGQDSVDLLALDIAQDLGEDSTLVTDTNTMDQSQPSWLELELNLPGAYPTSDNSPTCSLLTTRDEGVSGAVHTAPSSRESTAPDADTILGIDDAVNAVGQVQREALRSGKAVTVKIREPEEMSDWLEMRDVRVSKSAGPRRTLAMLWL